MNIAKSTLVTIKTTNGGEITTRLCQTYRPTYDAVIEVTGGYTIIGATRISSVVIASQPATAH